MEYNFDDYLILNSVKSQLRVDWDEDDDYIKEISESSLALVARYLNRNLYPSNSEIPDSDKTGIKYNKSIRIGVYLTIDNLYNNRGSFSETQLHENRTFKIALDSFRDLSVEML